MVNQFVPYNGLVRSLMLTASRYGTGFCIAYSGPVGALICFLIVGVDVFFVMQALGEMSTLFPIQGKQIYAAELEAH
jgi:amino acid permease